MQSFFFFRSADATHIVTISAYYTREFKAVTTNVEDFIRFSVFSEINDRWFPKLSDNIQWFPDCFRNAFEEAALSFVASEVPVR